MEAEYSNLTEILTLPWPFKAFSNTHQLASKWCHESVYPWGLYKRSLMPEVIQIGGYDQDMSKCVRCWFTFYCKKLVSLNSSVISIRISRQYHLNLMWYLLISWWHNLNNQCDNLMPKWYHLKFQSDIITCSYILFYKGDTGIHFDHE